MVRTASLFTKKYNGVYPVLYKPFGSFLWRSGSLHKDVCKEERQRKNDDNQLALFKQEAMRLNEDRS